MLGTAGNDNNGGLAYRSQNEVSLHALNDGGIGPSSPHDRNWSRNEENAPNTGSVYRGGTSGWTVTAAPQRPKANNHHPPSPSRTHYNSQRPTDQVDSPYGPQRWGSRQYQPPGHFSQNQVQHRQFPSHQMPFSASSSPNIVHQPPRFQGNDNQDYGKSREGLPMDELEIAEASLEAIFHELHEKRNYPDNRRSHPRNPQSNHFEITLTRPSIPEETKSELFHIFWSDITLHWPLFYRKSYNNEIAARRKTEEEHPLLFNAICSMASLIRKEPEGAPKQESGMTHRQMSTVFYARARY